MGWIRFKVFKVEFNLGCVKLMCVLLFSQNTVYTTKICYVWEI